MKVDNLTSKCSIFNTGTQQGGVHSPQLHYLFTNDCTANRPNLSLIKCADGITVIGMIMNDDECDYRNEINLLVKLSDDNHHILDVDKTKELIVDFRKSRNSNDSLIINGRSVEQANIYRFPGYTLMNTFSWTQNADKITKKGR